MTSYTLITPLQCGLVGTTKVLFALADVDYKLIKLSPEEMQKEKSRMPFGQLPVLEFDGKTLSQSRAIARFVAREYGLIGKNNYEQARADMIVDQIYDVVEGVKVWAKSKDPEKKEIVRQDLAKNVFPPVLVTLEKLLISNNGGNGYFVGDKPGFVDATFLSISQRWKLVSPDCLKDFPKLTALNERLLALPKVAENLKR